MGSIDKRSSTGVLHIGLKSIIFNHCFITFHKKISKRSILPVYRGPIRSIFPGPKPDLPVLTVHSERPDNSLYLGNTVRVSCVGVSHPLLWTDPFVSAETTTWGKRTSGSCHPHFAVDRKGQQTNGMAWWAFFCSAFFVSETSLITASYFKL